LYEEGISVNITPVDDIKMEKEAELEEDYLLMCRIVLKDEDAYQALVDKYMLDVFRFSFSLVGQKELAEDITQDVFTKLWQKAQMWQPTASVKTWLLTIARNRAIDLLRRQKPTMELLEDSPCIYAKDADQDVVLQNHMVEEEIKKSLFLLPERQKTALTLVYYLECSYKEAAEIMEISLNAFESLIARAKRNLRDILHDKKEMLI